MCIGSLSSNPEEMKTSGESRCGWKNDIKWECEVM